MILSACWLCVCFERERHLLPSDWLAFAALLRLEHCCCRAAINCFFLLYFISRCLCTLLLLLVVWIMCHLPAVLSGWIAAVTAAAAAGTRHSRVHFSLVAIAPLYCCAVRSLCAQCTESFAFGGVLFEEYWGTAPHVCDVPSQCSRLWLLVLDGMRHNSVV